MVFLESDDAINKLDEMFVNVLPNLPDNVENSIYYAKLKQALFNEIVLFCKEKTELKQDLNILRMNVGESLTEEFIRDYIEGLQAKYNTEDNNVGLEYHLEATKYDFSCVIFAIIKRDVIYCKKFVFRFRKAVTAGIAGLSNSGILLPSETKALREEKINKKFGL